MRPACSALGWELVGSKTEDGSFFLYMYGSTDSQAMVQRLTPFDPSLGFWRDGVTFAVSELAQAGRFSIQLINRQRGSDERPAAVAVR